MKELLLSIQHKKMEEQRTIISEKFDDGMIVAQRDEEVGDLDTTESMREKLDAKALALLKETLPKYLENISLS